MRLNSLFVALSVAFLSSHTTQAQQQEKEPAKLNTWSVTGYGGITRFFGDLREYDFKRGDKEPLTGMWGLSLNKQITPLFGAQLTFFNGSLAGSKKNVPNTDLATGRPVLGPDGTPYTNDVYFRSPSYLQATLDGTVNLNRLLLGNQKMRRWKVDAHAGFGIMYFYSRLHSMADDKLLIESNTSASSKTAGTWRRNGSVYTREWVFPVGLSVHYELSPRFDIGLNLTYNHVNTEKLDLTVGSLTNYDTQTGLWGFFKGESNQDKYASAAVTLTYKIGKNAARAKKGVVDTSNGRYHMRYINEEQLIPVPYNPTMNDADSIAKAVMPKPVDARLYTDTDGDGVADLFDQEPNTPAGSVVSGAGVAVNFQEYVTNSVKKQLPKDECEAFFSNIEFDTDKATIRSTSRTTLDDVVSLLNSRPNCRIVIIGHTDARASDSYNNLLSKRRVEAAKRYLVKAGLQDPSRVVIEYYGELQPISDNTSKTGMQNNRRVEIRIMPSNTLQSNYPAGFRK